MGLFSSALYALETTADSSGFLDAISQGFTKVIGWVGEFLTALTGGPLKSLLIFVGLGVGVTVVSYGVKVVKTFMWGAR